MKMAELVLVRAYGGKPIERVVWEVGERVVYVSHPQRVEDVRAGLSGAIGFPPEDVFRFDADLYGRLRRQWEGEGRTSPDLWAEGVPYGGA